MPLVVQELLTLLEHMSYYRLFNKSNTTYASSGPGTANKFYFMFMHYLRA
jgi:hypothetical protein